MGLDVEHNWDITSIIEKRMDNMKHEKTLIFNHKKLITKIDYVPFV